MRDYWTPARWLVAVAVAIAAAGAMAQVIDLEPPGQRDFVLDTANLIDEADEAQIKALCDTLLNETAIPIVVVTIESMAAHGGPNMRIETFATLLFDQWGIGDSTFNRGILLLVSNGDRKARIELGADWAHEYDRTCQEIMDGHIIFHFKQGQFSTGIVAGVEALDKMARGLELPSKPRPWWHYALVAGFIALAIFTAISLMNSGASGWAWVFWGVVFSILGFILYSALTSSARGGSGGFSGGSFGGGFSGGGGATGSW